MKQFLLPILAFFVFISLPALAEDKMNNSESTAISNSTGIISVIADMNTSGNQSIQDITEWIYIFRNENGNCTGLFEPVLEGNHTVEVIECPMDLMVINESEINFTKASEVILKYLSNETAYESVFLIKPLNSTEPVWSFITRDGKKILIGASSGEILSGVQTRSRAASRGAISDTISDVVDAMESAEYYVCVDACIAGCHSLPSDIYSPGYTLDNCISECPDDCKK